MTKSVILPQICVWLELPSMPKCNDIKNKVNTEVNNSFIHLPPLFSKKTTTMHKDRQRWNIILNGRQQILQVLRLLWQIISTTKRMFSCFFNIMNTINWLPDKVSQSIGRVATLKFWTSSVCHHFLQHCCKLHHCNLDVRASSVKTG
jgi:hypothetical protein